MEVVMAFSVNTNVGALSAYNALAKVNAQTQKAQINATTGTRINSVSDDTSGWNVGKQLESANLQMKSQLSNINSAKNFLSTAESALQQVYDKLNSIVSKQEDYKDPLKDKAALQNDVKTLADEIDSILTNTKINGTDLLASASNSFGAGSSAIAVNIGAKVGDNSTALTALKAGDATSMSTSIETFASNVRTAISYIGNNTQTLDSRQAFVTSAMANNTEALGKLFDADAVSEQLTSTSGQIKSQIATAQLSQMNSAPQQLLSLFR